MSAKSGGSAQPAAPVPGGSRDTRSTTRATADQVHIRRDLRPLRTGDETVADLKILTGRRMNLVADRTRSVNRCRDRLTSNFPCLKRALDLTKTAQPSHPADRLPDLGPAGLPPRRTVSY
ncbi:IS110 family transposase [Streptomyces sp. NBC_00358]|uniref:IS110 family transposase n=1 Tax=Streptomyces sp. NBC_00358 TaxID=2975725 RepID=UPI002E257249